MSCRVKVCSPIVFLVSLISCGSESRQSVTQESDVDSVIAESSSLAPPVIIGNTPNEQDRFSLLTGQISADSTVIVDSLENRVNEDERMSVMFVLLEPSYVNVQVSIGRGVDDHGGTVRRSRHYGPISKDHRTGFRTTV